MISATEMFRQFTAGLGFYHTPIVQPIVLSRELTFSSAENTLLAWVTRLRP
jgi:hypothetical protein